MQETSDLYKELLADENHWTETRLVIGEPGYLTNDSGSPILFGGTAIRVGTGTNGGFGENMLVSMGTDLRIFSEDTPTVGCCVAGEISVKMKMPTATIPKKARLRPFVRLTDGARSSEWIPKGVFYIDTRKTDESGEKNKWLTLTGYDGMLKAEADFPSVTDGWPDEGRRDLYVVQNIAEAMGVTVDARTKEIMDKAKAEGKSYALPLPTGYSMREVLSGIAGAYGGCFVMSDLGELRLVQLHSIK